MSSPPVVTPLLSFLGKIVIDVDEQREIFRKLVQDCIALGRPEGTTKSIYALGYGDLATDDIFEIIEKEYQGTSMAGVTTFADADLPKESFSPLARELRDWVNASAGIFTSFQIDREFGFTDRNARKARAKYLARLIDEGLIEKLPNREGTFKRVVAPEAPLQYQKPGDGEKIILPLGIHSLIKLFPGNVAIVAGVQNAGKTAFMLNLMMQNIGLYKVHYFSSEMGAEEMSLRLSNFTYERPERIFELANIYERASDFDDVIVPGVGNLNIVDYLEIGDNFFLVGDMVKRIWAKLQGALAFVAIQKKEKAKYGRGAEFGAEKARLYVTLENNTARIVKAKTWRSPSDNPNGKQTTFTLRNGCEFTLGKLGWRLPGEGQA